MHQTAQAIVGAVAALLAGVVVVGALAMLIVIEGYYPVGFWTRLYWRCKEGPRLARRGDEETVSSEQGQRGRPLDRGDE
jgi:hypothetical protein